MRRAGIQISVRLHGRGGSTIANGPRRAHESNPRSIFYVPAVEYLQHGQVWFVLQVVPENILFVFL